MGDPTKIVLLEAILKVIKRENLLSVVEKSGDVLMSGLRELEAEFPALINSTRGRGTFITFDAADNKLREYIVNKLLTKGKYYNNIVHELIVYILYLFYGAFSACFTFRIIIFQNSKILLHLKL